MKLINGLALLLLLGSLCFFLFAGCSGPEIKLSDSMPAKFSAYKQVVVYASRPTAISTGIKISKGEMFSIIVSGQVNTNPKRYAKRWEPGNYRLVMFAGDSTLHGPVNVTLKSDWVGEIKFLVYDGPYDAKRGRANNPDWYNSNLGRFDVTVIVWKNADWNLIAESLQNIANLNPEYKPLKDTVERTNRYKTLQIAETETAKEVEKTKKQLQALKDKEEMGSAKGLPKTETNYELLVKSATPTKTSAEIENLEAKLATLMNTLAQLEETKKQLSAEREKTSRLTQELETREKQKNKMIGKQYPPLLLIASPDDGQETERSKIQLVGVVEDNIGLSNFEIYINGKPFSSKNSRGMSIVPTGPIKRFEFKELLPLVKGANQIKVRATDANGQVTEKLLVIHKIQSGRNIWAVVIGIDTYPNIPQLKYGVSDARAFYSFLVKNNRIPSENVTLLVNEQATLANLRTLLGTKLKRNAGRDDMVIIYFAGHGATERDIMSPDGDGLEKYILPYDANPKDLYASALPMREISHILHRIQSERLVFIADACYSGASGGRTINLTGYRANMTDAYLDRIVSGKGRIIITASGANEVSMEKDELQHGVFTYFLLKGLGGVADFDKDGLVTVDEAYKYVSDTVPKATAQEQHPVKKGAVEGQLVLSIVQ